MKIHAYAALKPKESLVPFSYEAPALGPFDVLIKVSHCGLCHSDIHLIDNDWNRSSYPLIPGHEIIGNVVQTGLAIQHLKIGQRVGQSWIRSSCLCCQDCLQGDNNYCSERTTTCNRNFGGFADHVIGDGRFVFPIPDALDSAHAAPLLCAGATVFTPLKRYAPRSVAVVGVGGLGHLGLQFAKALGCEVSAISGSLSKEKDARRFGASHFFTPKHQPPANAFDLILLTIHEGFDWDQMLSFLKPKGVLCCLARPELPAPINISNLISTGRSVTGSSTASRFLMNEMLSFAAHQKISPMIERLALSQVNEAIAKVKANQARYRFVLDIQ